MKFIEQVKAYSEHNLVTADDVRALLGVLQGEQDASKAIFTTTSDFAPTLHLDRIIKPYLPYRLELVNRQRLLERLAWSERSIADTMPQ
ncbi:MAG: restriction endonuclease [Sphingomonas sp.]